MIGTTRHRGSEAQRIAEVAYSAFSAWAGEILVAANAGIRGGGRAHGNDGNATAAHTSTDFASTWNKRAVTSRVPAAAAARPRTVPIRMGLRCCRTTSAWRRDALAPRAIRSASSLTTLDHCT